MIANNQWLAQTEVLPWFGSGDVRKKKTSGPQRGTGRWEGIETHHDTHEAHAGPNSHYEMRSSHPSTATEKFVHITGILHSCLLHHQNRTTQMQNKSNLGHL